MYTSVKTGVLGGLHRGIFFGGGTGSLRLVPALSSTAEMSVGEDELHWVWMLPPQRWRQLRGDAYDKSDAVSGRQSSLGTTGDLQEFVHHRRRVLPVRQATVHSQVRLVDLRRISGLIIDIYTVDTVLPVHIVWHEEATAKSTTQDGGMAETSVNAFV